MTAPAEPRLAGLVLAAGAGRRLGGRPKSLLTGPDGSSLLGGTVERLRAVGCSPVLVVLGAAPEAAGLLRPGAADVVVAPDWAEGIGASLRRGLEALADAEAGAVLVTLADLPDVDEPVMRRVVDGWRAAGAAADALVRATFGGRPGHPVLIGRAHWAPLAGSVGGDVGAGPYLRARRVREVDCDDLATGSDLDHPGDLDAWARR